MRQNILFRTNAIVCVIIILGFLATSFLSYKSNSGILERDIEQVTTLAEDGVSNQISTIFSQPVSVSLTMANDSLLKDFLADEKPQMDDPLFLDRLRAYLDSYRVKYDYDSVFLVSTATNRYYHFNGLDRTLTPENPENDWYHTFLRQEGEYTLNVDNDEAADNVITVFVNCKIEGPDGAPMGIVGVGLKVDSLQTLLRGYDEKFDVRAYLVDGAGTLQISSTETGYTPVSLFDRTPLSAYRDEILTGSTERRTFWCTSGGESRYVVSRYIPALQWHLIVEKDTAIASRQFRIQFAGNIAVIALIITAVLIIITGVIRRYNRQIAQLTLGPELEYQRLLHEATEGLYDDIFEFDITHNCAGGDSTRAYFERQGIPGTTPYDKALRSIAETQLKPESVAEYLAAFSPAHVLEVFGSGQESLTCDFLIRDGDGGYHWIRNTARLFYWPTDRSVRMISYRRNIDAEKKREAALLDKSQRDSLTGLYNKRATEDLVIQALAETAPGSVSAFLIFDVDDFKTVNDRMGHAFGDTVIAAFAAELRTQFRDTDIVGRIGGDEFAVMIRDCGDHEIVHAKLDRFCAKLRHKDFGTGSFFGVTSSVGAALFPEHGASYLKLYEKADHALYFCKSHGKGSFQIFGEDSAAADCSHVDNHDLEVLVQSATDGISKIACVGERFRLLYFNASRVALTGTSARLLADPDYDVLGQIHPDDIPAALKIFRVAIPTRTPFSVYFRLRHEDGHYFPTRLKGLFVNELYENQYPIFYAVYTDLTSLTDN